VAEKIEFLDENKRAYGVKHINGKPRVSSMPYLYDIAEGNVSGHSIWDKYAINDDVDAANEEDIWCVGGSYSWLTGTTGLAIVSSSAEDDFDKVPAGTGIHKIRIYYTTDTFIESTTDVETDGTTPVNTSVTDIYRVNRVRPLIVGTGLKAAGNIDIKQRSGATIYSRIATGFTKGRQLIYTVPYGKTLFIAQASGSIGGTEATKYGRFTLRSTWDNVSLTRNAWMTVYSELGQQSGFFSFKYECPMAFPAGSDIVVSCKSLNDNSYVTASLRGWLETS
jgi:hypothetical protein